MRIIKDPTRERWNATTTCGTVVGYVYFDRQDRVYACYTKGERVRFTDRADALLWLSLKTDTKEGRDRYFYGDVNAEDRR